MDHFPDKYPESEINFHRLFHIELIHEIVQPLLSLKANPEGGTSYMQGGKDLPLQKEGFQGKPLKIPT